MEQRIRQGQVVSRMGLAVMLTFTLAAPAGAVVK